MPIAPEHLALAYEGPFYAYLYGRASHDPKKKGRSVTSQLGEGRETCDANGWPIIGEFRDDDRSASRYASKTREDFEEMLAGIEQGIPRILVAFEASRYYRDLEAYVRLRRACMEAGVLLCYDGAVYDLSKRADRKATAQDAIAAEDQAESIRDNNLRTVRQNAKAGGPHGRVLWGYMRKYDPATGELIGQFPHPDREDVPADVFDRFVGGVTIYSIVQHLVKTRDAEKDGRNWQYYHVYEMLRNPSYTGRRVFQGKDFAKATWPPLVKPEIFAAAQRILDAPGRTSVKDWSVKYMSAGIARCGRCPTDEMGWPPRMRSQPSGGRMTYTCAEKYDVSIRQEKLDAYVEEAVVEWLASKAPEEAFTSSVATDRAAKARGRHQTLSAQLSEARRMAAALGPDGAPQLSLASLVDLEARLQPAIDKAAREAETAAVPPLVRSFMGQSREVIEALWDGLTIEKQRAVLRLVVNVTVNRAPHRGARTIEPGRVDLVFVGESGFRAG
ncbi:recombinase family protein [Streptomyces sp. NPDC005953]|uniref:recombinase family protein n=1 Tax=Streptomyces sp. NPDC005953 TaxID=3156719 RepID=UPI0033F0EC75